MHNIPYIVDGDVKLTQSIAIMRYLSRKHKKLAPHGELQLQQVDRAEGMLVDMRFMFAMLCYNPEFDKMKDNFFAELPTKLHGLEEVLGKREWVAGELTYVDIAICEILDHMVLCRPECFDKLPNIKKYWARYEDLPQIKAYKSSDRYRKWPVYSKFATWGKSPATSF